jgi:hypothetical protein
VSRGIPLLIAEKEVASHPDIRHLGVAALQPPDEVGHYFPVQGGLGHGLAVGGGVLNLLFERNGVHACLAFPTGCEIRA